MYRWHNNSFMNISYNVRNVRRCMMSLTISTKLSTHRGSISILILLFGFVFELNEWDNEGRFCSFVSNTSSFVELIISSSLCGSGECCCCSFIFGCLFSFWFDISNESFGNFVSCWFVLLISCLCLLLLSFFIFGLLAFEFKFVFEFDFINSSISSFLYILSALVNVFPTLFFNPSISSFIGIVLFARACAFDIFELGTSSVCLDDDDLSNGLFNLLLLLLLLLLCVCDSLSWTFKFKISSSSIPINCWHINAE